MVVGLVFSAVAICFVLPPHPVVAAVAHVAMEICGKCLLASVMLLLGSCLTILWKVLLTLQGTGPDGERKLFHKPLFTTMEMFFAMFLVLPAYHMKKLIARTDTERERERGTPLQSVSKQEPTYLQHLRDDSATSDSSDAVVATWKQHFQIAVPAICDLVVTCLSAVSLIIVPSSVWQMLAGSRIIFTALMTVLVLRRNLQIHHWVGVLLASSGVLLISIATVADSSASRGISDNRPTPSIMALGVGICILAEVICAVQDVVEEKLVTDLDIDPLKVVGMEGAWGLLIISLLVYPVCWLIHGYDGASLEDPVDTYYLIKSSTPIQLVVLVMVFVDATYNVVGMNVTKFLTAIMRSMVSASKGICVWMFNMGWYYFVNPKSAFGEPWSNMGVVKALGFGLLVVGQVTYSEDYRWPCFDYPKEVDSEDDGSSKGE